MACIGVLGCGSGPSIATQRITISASPRANDNSPIPLDIVVVFDTELLNALLQMPATTWFEQRDQLRRDHPAGVASESWELVPGSALRVDPLPFSVSGGVALLVFADYLSPGNHRARLDPYTSVTIRLLDDGFVIEGESGGSDPPLADNTQTPRPR